MQILPQKMPTHGTFDVNKFSLTKGSDHFRKISLANGTILKRYHCGRHTPTRSLAENPRAIQQLVKDIGNQFLVGRSSM